MKQLPLLILLIGLFAGSAAGQTFNGNGGMLTNDGNPNYYAIPVSNLEQPLLGEVYGLETVCVKITHTADAELDIRLIAPDGTQVILSNGNGGSGDNYYTTCFNDFAPNSIYNGTPPYNGSFRPEQPVGTVNNGQEGTGEWQLYVCDMVANNNNTGYMAGWSITFGYNPGPVFHFNSSNLPIIIIDTHGQSIPDDPKIPVDFGIIDNGPGERNFIDDTYAFYGTVGIEVRGSSSQMFPKKSYGLETWDVFGQSIDTSLLGMPSESDWILNANYSDKTLCRNVMAYQSFMNMGHYATRYRFVEVVLNDEYIGVYIFSEKIKRDNNRVDISKLNPEDSTGDELTGGYIIKIDKTTGSGGDGWISPFPPPTNPSGQTIFMMYEYPKADEITQVQKDYIEDYVTDFETVLEGPFFADTSIGFRKYAQELTFIDYFLVNEISKNVDGYRLSTFFHKEKDSEGGRLRMGPVWDYDIAWHNADYCGGDAYTGWAYQFPCEYDYWQVPFWWTRLLQDPLFASHLKCRWLELRNTTLSNAYFTSYLDSLAGLLNEAQVRNFIQWPILGTYVWPNPWPYPETYEEEISVLKEWLSNRLAWMDNNLPGTCYTVGKEELAGQQPEFIIFPNPATSTITIDVSSPLNGEYDAAILDQTGLPVLIICESKGMEFIDVSNLTSGVYLVRLKVHGRVLYRKLIKI